MNIKKIQWWLDGGGTSAEYQAILDRATARGFSQPTASQKVKQNTLLTSLKTAGVFQKLDWLYVTLNNVGLDFGRINWVAPSTFELTGSPTFTSNQGVKSNGSTYLDTTWDYGNRVNFSQNSACAFVWVFTNGNDGRAAMGAILSATDRTIALTTRDASDRASQYTLNAASASSGVGGTVTNDSGLHLVNRVNATDQTHYRNDVQTATASVASIAPSSIDVSLLCRNFNGARDTFFLRDCSVFGAGAGLSSGERTVLYNAISTYVSSPE